MLDSIFDLITLSKRPKNLIMLVCQLTFEIDHQGHNVKI